MTEPTIERRRAPDINWKGVSYGLLMLLIGMASWTFLNILADTKAVNARQDNSIHDLEAITRQISETNAVLTRIVNEHEEDIKTIQSNRYKPTN